jgi:hypothetical protein
LRGRLPGVAVGEAGVVVRADGREAHFYSQSAPRLGVGGEGCLVCVGDGLDDGEPEAGPVGVAASVGGEPLEGLEEPVDVGGRDRRAGVGDGQDGATVPGAGQVPGTTGVADTSADEPGRRCAMKTPEGSRPQARSRATAGECGARSCLWQGVVLPATV